MDIPDAAVAAAANAVWWEGTYNDLQANDDWGATAARVVLSAALPHIAAAVLRDAAERIEPKLDHLARQYDPDTDLIVTAAVAHLRAIADEYQRTADADQRTDADQPNADV